MVRRREPVSVPLLFAVDHALRERAASLHADYPRLRLRLARFAWGGKGVERRAAAVLCEWTEGILRDCIADAEACNVPPERYVRNLIGILSPWFAGLLAGGLSRKAGLRAVLPSFDASSLVGVLATTEGRLFADLLRERPVPLSPAVLGNIVPLQAASAWARWFNCSEQRRAMRLTGLRRSWRGLDDKEFQQNVLAVAGYAGLSKAELDTLMAQRQSREEISHRQWLKQAAETLASGRFQDPAVLDLVLEAGKPDLGGPARRAIARVLPGLRAEANSSPVQLRAALEVAALDEPLLALKVHLLDTEAGLEALREKPSLMVRRALRLLPAATLRKLFACLLRVTLPDSKGDVGGGLGSLTELVNAGIKLTPIEELPAILIRRKQFGDGSWRRTAAERVGSMSTAEMSAFLEAANPLENGWMRLPLTVRESALEAWQNAGAKKPDLAQIAARTCPSLLVDAARWANDPRALGALLAGPDPRRALAEIQRVGQYASHPGFRDALLSFEAAGQLPDAVKDRALRDRELQRALLVGAPALFRKGPIEWIDPAILLEAALRWAWLGRRMSETVPANKLRRALPTVRRHLANRPRLLAAAEMAVATDPRYAFTLAYLSTRPLPGKDAVGTRFDSLYSTWKLPKRKGGVRTITAPSGLLKAVQRSLLDQVLSKVTVHPAATGFHPGKSIVDNARPHVGQRVVLNVDIAGFFPGTRFALVRHAVETAMPRWMSAEGRRLATDICCHGGGLPIGAPTSPCLANIIMRSADKAISKVAQRRRLAYTRYADDITLSGDDPAPVLPFVRQVLKGLGYELDPKKTNIFRRGRRQVVTGLVVNDKVSVPRVVRRRLRAAVHRATMEDKPPVTWHGREMAPQELEGRIAFIGVAHPEVAQALRNTLKAGRRRG